jgi:hypothetical protein
MRGVAIIYMCVLAACASATPGNPDAKGSGGADAAIDASQDTVDAPGTVDAPDTFDAPSTPDAMPPDAMPDAGVVTTAPDTCAQALDITTAAHAAGGATYTGDTTGYADDVEPDGCTGYTPDGPDAIYIVTLAANETLTATATPTTSWDISLELASNCVHAATCVVGSDSGFAGDPESITYVATAAGTFYLAVDGYNPGVAGPFSLSVHIQ